VHGLDHPTQTWPTSRWHCRDGENKKQLRCANVFHAVTQLHPLILFDANDPDQLHCCELFGADILKPAWPWAAR
jgi:hypothetical protein